MKGIISTSGLLVIALFCSLSPVQVESQTFPTIQCNTGGSNLPGYPTVNCIGGTPLGVLGPTNGALGPFALATPAPGSTDFFEGDSLAAGFARTCSGTSASPSGTCFSDLVSIHDAAREVNVAVTNTCLEFTTTGGSVCNQSSTTNGSLINRYIHDMASLTSGMRVYMMIGTNDATAWAAADPQISAVTFRANLVTVTTAYAGIVGASNLILGEIPYSNPTHFDSQVDLLNAQISSVATQFGYRLAPTAEVYQTCGQANSADTNLCYNSTIDRTHPDTLGDQTFATAFETANYQTSVAALDASRKTLTLDYRLNNTNNVNLGGFGTLAFIQASSSFNTCGGYTSCAAITTGQNNVGIGALALLADTTGGFNVAIGLSAASAMLGGGQNVCVGYTACNTVTSGVGVTDIGYAAEAAGPAAFDETCIGYTCAGQGNHTVTLGGSGVTNVLTYGGYCPSNALGAVIQALPCYYAGSGVPTLSAMNGSAYLRKDGTTGLRVYYNASGANTTGTTWTALAAPSFVSCTDASIGVISCSATVAYTSTTSYACGMSYVGPTTTTGTATGTTVVNTSNTSVTGTVVGLAVATGTATILFNCTGT